MCFNMASVSPELSRLTLTSAASSDLALPLWYYHIELPWFTERPLCCPAALAGPMKAGQEPTHRQGNSIWCIQ